MTTSAEHELRRIEALWHAQRGTPEGDELDSLIDAVVAFEELEASEHGS